LGTTCLIFQRCWPAFPDKYKFIAAIGIGSFFLVGLVLLHGADLYRILTLRKRFPGNCATNIADILVLAET
jgi:hypothetical protein